MSQTVSVRPGLALPIQSGKKLFVEFGSLGGQLQCTCIGLVDNTHIIIRPPTGHSASLVNLSENVSVVVKYMDGARIFGFKSTIEHVILRPYLLIFIAHPFSAEELDLRKDIRCPCFLPMNCTLPGSTAEMYGFIVDINRFGCRFVITRTIGEVGELPYDTPIVLNFSMSNIEITGLHCLLRTICKNEKTGIFGVKFNDSDPQAELVIEDFVKNYKMVTEIQDEHAKAGPNCSL